MVHLGTLFPFFASLALAAPAKFPLPFYHIKRDVPTVEADIASFSTQVTALDNSIKAFPDTGGSILDALAIHSNAQTIVQTLTTAAADVRSTGPVGESDGATIFNSVQATVPTILDSLIAIVAKKPAFEGLPIAGLTAIVSSDLASLNSTTTDFGNALIANAPADLVANATALQSNVSTAFATAIAAYATA